MSAFLPMFKVRESGQEKASNSKLLHHKVDIILAGCQAVGTVVILPSREAESHFHHGLLVLLCVSSRTTAASVDSFEGLDSAFQARTEGPLVAIAGDAVVLVLYHLLVLAFV